MNTTIEFTGDDGSFAVHNPDLISYLYFPLANEAGMMCSISPDLQGDAKTGNNTFLLTPVSAEDLHNARDGRNFWLYINDQAWSVAGTSAKQRAEKYTKNSGEHVTLEAGFLWHKVTRKNVRIGITAEITNFVPANGAQVELMQVVLTNIGNKKIFMAPTAAIPLYGRSADNIRDHRHVTSLLHRIRTTRHGIIVTPTLSFDEHGHQENKISYAVFGSDHEEKPPVEFFPIVEDFIGEGGSLDWPEAVVSNLETHVSKGIFLEGYEAIGGLRFAPLTLKPGAIASFRLVLSVQKSDDPLKNTIYLSKENFLKALAETKSFWKKKLDTLTVETGDQDFNRWFRWVTLQPTLRRIYGCSFLPHHDYGRGGRGWRDLWQDCLALLLMEPRDVRNLLYDNFAGVRFDGSNATIIGNGPGEFLADRNNIPRVWMDHSVWPLLTTKLYIDQTGDLSFLLEEQSYFKDMHINRCIAHDSQWDPDDVTVLKQENGIPYKGSILEHILVQLLTSFFNVGEHNHIKLEGGDWNDGLDMARQRGESVAFSAMYGSNLLALSDLLLAIENRLGITEIALAKEMTLLLDTLKNGIDYNSDTLKRELLEDYFETCTHVVSGEKVTISIIDLVNDLQRKGNWILEYIQANEWIQNTDGFGWFNGYYDNNGNRLEGDHDTGVRMTLTGQVFTVMSGAATDQQVHEIVRAVNKYLWDDKIGGCRLNTNFQQVLMNMGRCFGFAFGHKENGAMFSHMAVMYAYALYSRGLVQEGFKVLDTIYRHCLNFEISKIYPGIPEYFNDRGRGMYHYLTGSASWYLLTMLTQSFGVKGLLGDLLLLPKLISSQFKDGKASVITLFADKKLKVIYQNASLKDYGEYAIMKVSIDNDEISFTPHNKGALIERKVLDKLIEGTIHTVHVELG